MTTKAFTFGTRFSAVAVVLVSQFLLPAQPAAAQSSTKPVGDTKRLEILTTRLSDVPGKKLSVAVIEYGPGAASPAHEHPGSVLVHVLSGAVRSQAGDEPAPTIYRAGESFFEKPKAGHLISENASATESARFLAVFLSEEGDPLTRKITTGKPAE